MPSHAAANDRSIFLVYVYFLLVCINVSVLMSLPSISNPGIPDFDELAAKTESSMLNVTTKKHEQQGHTLILYQVKF